MSARCRREVRLDQSQPLRSSASDPAAAANWSVAGLAVVHRLDRRSQACP